MIDTDLKEITTEDKLHRVFSVLQKHAPHFSNTTAKQRIALLEKLLRVFENRREDIKKAVYKDYKRNPVETELSDIWLVIKELKFAIRRLKHWMKPKRVPTPLVFLGSSSEIHYEAKGVVLILSPWNFPFNLSFAPLVSAIAAGNTVIIKPSEFTTNSSHLIREIIEEVFPPYVVSVCEGGVDMAKNLLKLPFNHIFFTGSPGVGRIVMKAAAENLASVTLELGGKTPVIVDETANLKQAAQSAIYAKFLNNGQVCLATDYILVQEDVAEDFKRHLLEQLEQIYPAKDLNQNSDYARVVNNRQFASITHVLEDAERKGAKLLTPNVSNSDDCFMAPVIIENVSEDMLIDQQEIFGPLLPLRTYKTIDDVAKHINAGEKPLALYLFSNSKKHINYILKNTSSGAALVNEVFIHHFNSHLPFGGINHSGIGKSHGHFGFLEFSNQKSVVKQWLPFRMSSLIQPPYTGFKKKLVKLIIKYFS